jgi:DNA-binding transcriptional LysR family regulator
VRQQSDLQELAIFSKVVEARSFSAAARAFDTTTSAISKRIAKLEKRLRVRLLARTTRHVSPTDAGTALYGHALRILADVADAEAAIARIGGSVRGTLRVSAPTIFGEHHVAPLLPRLLAAHPDLRIEMSVTDRFVNLAEEELDCAVRIGTLSDSNLIGVRIGEVQALVCASPSYLERRGTPTTPHDLGTHECIRYSRVSMAREWRFRTEAGGETSVPVTGRLMLNSGSAMAAATIAGGGVARLPMFLIEDALARGDLVEVLAPWKTKPAPVHVVYPSTPLVAPKLRAFIDVLGASCRESGRAARDRPRAHRT